MTRLDEYTACQHLLSKTQSLISLLSVLKSISSNVSWFWSSCSSMILMVLHLFSSSKASITGVTMDNFLKCSVLEGLGGCTVKVIATKNLRLVWSIFCSLSSSLSSPLTWSSSHHHHPNPMT